MSVQRSYPLPLLALCATALVACGTGNKSGTDSSGLTGTVVLIGVVVSGVGTTMLTAADTAYLENNGTAIRIALSRGHGSFISDLADAVDLPERLIPRLAVALRANRAALAEGLDLAIADPRARHVFRDRLIGALTADDELAPHVERTLSRR